MNDSLLQSTFGDEYGALVHKEKHAIRSDFAHATESEGISCNEYHRRIGTGNLRKYAACLLIQSKRTQ